MKKIVLGFLIGLFTCMSVGLTYAEDLVGSKGGDKYHLSSCTVAAQIKADNKVTFQTPEEAIKAGYTACKKCNPPAKSAAAEAFVGSKDSDKFHKADCRLAKNIKADNKVSFATKEDAEKVNYKPCAICFPPAKKDVKTDIKK